MNIAVYQIATIVCSIVVIVSILLQGNGAGLGSAWGGGGETFQTRRGLEKIFLYITIIAIVAFFILAIIQLRI